MTNKIIKIKKKNPRFYSRIVFRILSTHTALSRRARRFIRLFQYVRQTPVHFPVIRLTIFERKKPPEYGAVSEYVQVSFFSFFYSNTIPYVFLFKDIRTQLMFRIKIFKYSFVLGIFYLNCLVVRWSPSSQVPTRIYTMAVCLLQFHTVRNQLNITCVWYVLLLTIKFLLFARLQYFEFFPNCLTVFFFHL
jgi:hypothetical protein